MILKLNTCKNLKNVATSKSVNLPSAKQADESKLLLQPTELKAGRLLG